MGWEKNSTIVITGDTGGIGEDIYTLEYNTFFRNPYAYK